MPLIPEPNSCTLLTADYMPKPHSRSVTSTGGRIHIGAAVWGALAIVAVLLLAVGAMLYHRRRRKAAVKARLMAELQDTEKGAPFPLPLQSRVSNHYHTGCIRMLRSC